MVSAIILCGGSSERMNGVNKLLEKIDGVPVFIMSALGFERSSMVDEIILAVPAGEEARYEKLANNYGVTKLTAAVSGGATRFLSVKSALERVSPKADYIAIHDGARPLITTSDIERVLSDARRYNAAIAAAPAVDTVKLVGSNGFIESTPPRAHLYYAQTPQAFSKKLYLSCIERLAGQAEGVTDDSSILEMCGEYVRVTEISGCNMKITYAEDLAAAQAIYSQRKTVKRI